MIILFLLKTYQSSSINLSPQNIAKIQKNTIMGYYSCNKPWKSHTIKMQGLITHFSY